jgi:hypothetical protein
MNSYQQSREIMMTPSTKTIVSICFFICLLSTQVQAKKRTFQIDVLVFKQTISSTEALNTSNPPLSWPKGLSNANNNSRSSSTLSNAAAILAKKPEYSILKHASWTQTISSDRAGKPIRIQGNGINGFVQLRRGHNLHLNVGMEYPNHSGGQTFSFSEQRRILLNKKHYFDHPRLGAIINVSPL